ncbi:MAG: DinB family protein [Candidatus Promineifilaceae bacterium]|nr:DinB family protein [Candidatus Promineifilaceae bacterium]
MQEPLPVPTLLQRLESFARDVEQALSDPLVDWECAPAPGEWCLTEVVCHLRDVEKEVHQRRFRALIEEGEAFIPGVAADDWIEERAYREQHGPTALAQFLEARRETLVLLQDLDEAVWKRQGQHAFFGPTSLHELLNLAVQHDAAHWEQIDNLLTL